MKFSPTCLLPLPIAACFAVGAASAMGGGVPNDPPIENELVVRPASGHTIAESVDALSTAGLVSVQIADFIPGRDTFLLTHVLQPGVELADLEIIVATLTASGIAAWAEVNYQIQTAEAKTDSLWVTGIGFGDWYGQQYPVTVLGLPAAHARTHGQGVVVAILDTGVDLAHPAVQGLVAPGAWNIQSNSPDIQDAGNGVDDDGDGLVDEGVGHGTFVASLIRLVAPEAFILPIRVLDSEGRADNYRIAKAMNYAIDHGAQVINMSMGTTYRSAGMEEAAAEASSKGIVIVGSMGNYGVETPREYPASDNKAFGVAATDAGDIVASFSNFGPRTDFCAPGASLSLGGNAQLESSVIGAVPGGGFASWRGTSFAAAFVSGTAALVRAQHPEWPSKAVPPDAVADAVMALVAAGAVDITPLNPAYEGGIGQGRVDAAASALLSPPAPRIGDLDGDGSVDGEDLGILLGSWGSCTGCTADINRDGAVDGGDLGFLLGSWS